MRDVGRGGDDMRCDAMGVGVNVCDLRFGGGETLGACDAGLLHHRTYNLPWTDQSY